MEISLYKNVHCETSFCIVHVCIWAKYSHVLPIGCRTLVCSMGGSSCYGLDLVNCLNNEKFIVIDIQKALDMVTKFT